jgi:hypothetical protein
MVAETLDMDRGRGREPERIESESAAGAELSRLFYGLVGPARRSVTDSLLAGGALFPNAEESCEFRRRSGPHDPKNRRFRREFHEESPQARTWDGWPFVEWRHGLIPRPSRWFGHSLGEASLGQPFHFSGFPSPLAQVGSFEPFVCPCIPPLEPTLDVSRNAGAPR